MKSFQTRWTRRENCQEPPAKNNRDPDALFALTLAAGMESNAD